MKEQANKVVEKIAKNVIRLWRFLRQAAKN